MNNWLHQQAKRPDCLLAAFPLAGTIVNLANDAPTIVVPETIVNGQYSIAEADVNVNTGVYVPQNNTDFTVVHKFTAEAYASGYLYSINTTASDGTGWPIALCSRPGAASRQELR
ncbi:MAG: hypothetical protein PHI35_08695 [Victivallaceae bacterium]|nr:hypothetical protein [Victivallaceae bacterium]